LPSHKGHGDRSVALVKALCERLHVPSDYEQLAVLVAAYHGECHHALELSSEKILSLLEHLDAFRRPARLPAFLLACQADSQGRLGFEHSPYKQADVITNAYHAAAHIDTAAIAAAAPPGAIKEAIRKARLEAIAPPPPKPLQ
jgi:tRNA nucleotidyltransferase (CCA-adding enzyme)